jgi:hypothetical protein
MTVPQARLSPEAVRSQLSRLRQGPALGHPGAVAALSGQLRTLLLDRQPPLARTASETTRLVAALRQVIDNLSPHERRYAVADFNLVPEHSWPTLTQRQESLARVLGCSAKTVHRHAGQALDTLALLIADGSYLTAPPGTASAGAGTVPSGEAASFLGITSAASVHVVCSALTAGSGRPRGWDEMLSRYAGFADLDALVYVRVRLAQEFPAATIRDFYPGEYYSSDPDSMIVLGTSHRNSVYAEFMPYLPYRFDPPPGTGITFPGHGVHLAPQWTPEGELLTDLAVITRLTLAQSTTVVLLGGCTTLGVLGAAKCLLAPVPGQRNRAYLHDLAPDGDLIAVTVTRKISSITDTPDLTATEPLLILTREHASAFTIRLDNTARHQGA